MKQFTNHLAIFCSDTKYKGDEEICGQHEGWREDCPFLQQLAFRLHRWNTKLHDKFGGFFDITAIQEKAQQEKISTDMLY